jgi:TonB family protein
MPPFGELRFGLLPERKLNWRSIAASYGLEIFFLLVPLLAGVIWPNQLRSRQRHSIVDLVPPLPELSPAPSKLKEWPRVATKLLPPALIVTPTPLLVRKELRAEVKLPVEAPKVVMNSFKPVVLDQSTARQPKLFYTGSVGSSPTPSVNAPDATKQVSSITPAEIIYKPKPVYTEDALRSKLQGEVLLEVTFGAGGQVHVDRVIRGLGHGLDEAAINATNKIRFKPALRDGVPVDTTAFVYVTFQLAFKSVIFEN